MRATQLGQALHRRFDDGPLFECKPLSPGWPAFAGHDNEGDAAVILYAATPTFFAHHAVISGTNSIVTTTLAATSTVAKGAASA